ncbi:MAG: hypothetical protein JJE07_10035 [Flavobacteriaceae bacterium]|nr:hypothetical protein [Flavobacteriaceae bacterium]
MGDFIENEFAKFWIDDGIVFFVYKPHIIVDLKAAEKIVADRIKLQEEKAYPVFCDTRGIKDVNKEARDYLAKEGSTLAIAVGFLVDFPVNEAIAQFYVKTNKPLVPTEVFTNKDEAMDFLKSFLQ